METSLILSFFSIYFLGKGIAAQAMQSQVSDEQYLDESFEILLKKLKSQNHDKYIFCENLFE